tara:strand:- start:26294 stop:32575 length:6282 start_codon:yes stop_codon:yes gene_type:complete
MSFKIKDINIYDIELSDIFTTQFEYNKLLSELFQKKNITDFIKYKKATSVNDIISNRIIINDNNININLNDILINKCKVQYLNKNYKLNNIYIPIINDINVLYGNTVLLKEYGDTWTIDKYLFANNHIAYDENKFKKIGDYYKYYKLLDSPQVFQSLDYLYSENKDDFSLYNYHKYLLYDINNYNVNSNDFYAIRNCFSKQCYTIKNNLKKKNNAYQSNLAVTSIDFDDRIVLKNEPFNLEGYLIMPINTTNTKYSFIEEYNKPIINYKEIFNNIPSIETGSLVNILKNPYKNHKGIVQHISNDDIEVYLYSDQTVHNYSQSDLLNISPYTHHSIDIAEINLLDMIIPDINEILLMYNNYNLYNIQGLNKILANYNYSIDDIPVCYSDIISNILSKNINNFINFEYYYKHYSQPSLTIDVENIENELFNNYFYNILNLFNNNNYQHLLTDTNLKLYNKDKELFNSELETVIFNYYKKDILSYYNYLNYSHSKLSTLLYNTINNTSDNGLTYFRDIYFKNKVYEQQENDLQLKIDKISIDNIDSKYEISNIYTSLTELLNDNNKTILYDIALSTEYYKIYTNDFELILTNSNNTLLYPIKLYKNNKTITVTIDDFNNYLNNINKGILCDIFIKNKDKFILLSNNIVRANNIAICDNKYYIRQNNSWQLYNNLDIYNINSQIFFDSRYNKLISNNNNQNLKNYYTNILADIKEDTSVLTNIQKQIDLFKYLYCNTDNINTDNINTDNINTDKINTDNNSNILYKDVSKYHIENYTISINTVETYTDYINLFTADVNKNKLSINGLYKLKNSKYGNYKENDKVIGLIDKYNKKDRDVISNLYKYVFQFDLIPSVANIKDTDRAFFKLNDIIYNLDFWKKTDLYGSFIAEAPGSFIKNIRYLRNRYTEYKTWNNFKILTLIEDTNTMFQDSFNVEFKNHIVYDSEHNGDVTKVANLKQYKEIIKNNTNGKFADIATADGGFPYSSREEEILNLKEHIHAKLVFGEILAAIMTQASGGIFVLKMFDVMTDWSVKMIYLLSLLYTEIQIVKPINSRIANDEKYILCIDFRVKDEDRDNIETKLLKILDDWEDNKNNNYTDINLFPNINLSDDFINKIIEYNQFKIISQNSAINQAIDLFNNKDKSVNLSISNHLKFSKNNNINPLDYLETKIETAVLYCVKYNINFKEKFQYLTEIKSLQQKIENNELVCPHNKAVSLNDKYKFKYSNNFIKYNKIFRLINLINLENETYEILIYIKKNITKIVYNIEEFLIKIGKSSLKLITNKENIIIVNELIELIGHDYCKYCDKKIICKHYELMPDIQKVCNKYAIDNNGSKICYICNETLDNIEYEYIEFKDNEIVMRETDLDIEYNPTEQLSDIDNYYNLYLNNINKGDINSIIINKFIHYIETNYLSKKFEKEDIYIIYKTFYEYEATYKKDFKEKINDITKSKNQYHTNFKHTFLIMKDDSQSIKNKKQLLKNELKIPDITNRNELLNFINKFYNNIYVYFIHNYLNIYIFIFSIIKYIIYKDIYVDYITQPLVEYITHPLTEHEDLINIISSILHNLIKNSLLFPQLHLLNIKDLKSIFSLHDLINNEPISNTRYITLYNNLILNKYKSSIDNYRSTINFTPDKTTLNYGITSKNYDLTLSTNSIFKIKFEDKPHIYDLSLYIDNNKLDYIKYLTLFHFESDFIGQKRLYNDLNNCINTNKSYTDIYNELYLKPINELQELFTTIYNLKANESLDKIDTNIYYFYSKSLDSIILNINNFIYNINISLADILKIKKLLDLTNNISLYIHDNIENNHNLLIICKDFDLLKDFNYEQYINIVDSKLLEFKELILKSTFTDFNLQIIQFFNKKITDYKSYIKIDETNLNQNTLKEIFNTLNTNILYIINSYNDTTEKQRFNNIPAINYQYVIDLFEESNKLLKYKDDNTYRFFLEYVYDKLLFNINNINISNNLFEYIYKYKLYNLIYNIQNITKKDLLKYLETYNYNSKYIWYSKYTIKKKQIIYTENEIIKKYKNYIKILTDYIEQLINNIYIVNLSHTNIYTVPDINDIDNFEDAENLNELNKYANILKDNNINLIENYSFNEDFIEDEDD